MLRKFSFYNPTKIYFGKDSLDNLKAELANYGDTVLLTYGKKAIKSIGLYDQGDRHSQRCREKSG